MPAQFPYQSDNQPDVSQPLYSAYQTPVYPPLPMPSVFKSKSQWLWIAAFIAAFTVAFFGGVFVGRVSANNSSASSMALSTPLLSTTAPFTGMTSAHHKIKETVSVNGIWQVAVTKVSMSQGDEFTIPKAGDIFLQVDVSMRNISNVQRFAGESLFSLRDAGGQKYKLTFLSNATPPNSEVSAGDPLAGTLTFEVPVATKAFVLNFSATFASQQVSWDITEN